MRRIVHLSDLHCPPERPNQSERLIEATIEAKPDLVVVTGDLTRGGRRHEFDSARRMLDKLPATHLIVPGNHDVPVLNLLARLTSPFGRFHNRIAVKQAAVFVDEEIAVVGLNTARGVQPRLNWSMGVASERAVRKAMTLFVRAAPGAVRILVSHHPIVPDLRDPGRSSTRGAARALALTSDSQVSILMHGHLHRARAEAIANGDRSVIAIGAGSALSDRERDEPASFNVIAIESGEITVTEMKFDRHAYASGRCWQLPIPSYEAQKKAASVA